MSDDILKTARDMMRLESEADEARSAYEDAEGEGVDESLYAATLGADCLRDEMAERSAPKLARFALLVDRFTRDKMLHARDRAGLIGMQTLYHEMADLRRRLGLPSSSLGESGSGEVAGE